METPRQTVLRQQLIDQEAALRRWENELRTLQDAEKRIPLVRDLITHALADIAQLRAQLPREPGQAAATQRPTVTPRQRATSSVTPSSAGARSQPAPPSVPGSPHSAQAQLGSPRR